MIIFAPEKWFDKNEKIMGSPDFLNSAGKMLPWSIGANLSIYIPLAINIVEIVWHFDLEPEYNSMSE